MMMKFTSIALLLIVVSLGSARREKNFEILSHCMKEHGNFTGENDEIFKEYQLCILMRHQVLDENNNVDGTKLRAYFSTILPPHLSNTNVDRVDKCADIKKESLKDTAFYLYKCISKTVYSEIDLMGINIH